MTNDYKNIKEMVLKRFKLNVEKFRTLFAQHKKMPKRARKYYSFELKTYFEVWISEFNITSFKDLKTLILSEKLRKR